MAVTLYGINACDTVKRARAWLSTRDIVYVFHDFRKDGITAELVEFWLDTIPLETLLNRRSSSWRNLAPARQHACNTPAKAVAHMVEHPTLIKRPVLVNGNKIRVGFNAEAYHALFCG